MFIREPIAITTIEELKRLTRKQPIDCKVALVGGLYSRKTISRKGEYWTIVNYIDGSKNYRLTDIQLAQQTNLLWAMKVGALILE